MTKVILLQDVERLGKAGDSLSVKGGYARNFLIPRGLAVAANPATSAQVQALQQARGRTSRLLQEKAEEVAGRLAGLVLTIPMAVGDQEKLHGAVTAADLQRELSQQGIPIEKQQIFLEKPLSHLGEVQVPVHLHPQVKASVRVQLVRRQPQQPQ